MNKKQKKNLIRIIIAAVLMVGLHFVPATGWLRFFLYMIPYLVVGYDILIKAWKGIKNLQPLDECFLMVVATLGAIGIAISDSGDYTEAVAVMLFYQIGEWFQSYAIDKSRRNISELMDIRPDYANVKTDDGNISKVDPDEVPIGTIILCQPGEKVPIDGIVVSGKSSLDTTALTGESRPRTVSEGDEIISGCINGEGVLEIRTTKEFGESTVSKILDMVENASSKKSHSEAFISKFARVYTPLVVGCALILAIVPPLVLSVMGKDFRWMTWVYRALIFLVISCPCALVISIPLTFFAGIGGAGRAGVLVKGSNYLETLSKVRTLVCDKTGTLTEGVFNVVEIHSAGHYSPGEVLEMAALAECASSHPISKSLINEYLKTGSDLDSSRVRDVEEISGHGIKATVDGRRVLVGNDKLMNEGAVNYEIPNRAGTIIYVSVDGSFGGYIVIDDELKPTAEEAIKSLKAVGVNRIVMLTGDETAPAEQVANSLGIQEFYAKLLPGNKVEKVEGIIGESGGVTAFVGDGVNDAPVLSRADVGIAMGAMGSDAAIEAADVVLMDDDPAKIPLAIRIAKKCIRIANQNIWFAIGIKVICLILAAFGIANMWLAIFADVGVMVIAVLNALRALMVNPS